MGISHPNADVGAEMDTQRGTLDTFEHIVTKDEHDKQTNVTTLEYINGEGDPPFIKYRLTMEAVSSHTPAEYAELKDKAATDQETSQAAE
jgi:hypothetical protein